MDPLAPPASWKALKPDFWPILIALTKIVPRSVVQDISSSVLGEEVEAHQMALEQILLSGKVPSPLPWHPREALMMYNYREPEIEMSSQAVIDSYAGRMLASTILLRGACDEANQDEVLADITDVQRLCESALALGDEYTFLAGRFLAQCAYAPDCLQELHAYVALGALILSIDRKDLAHNDLKEISQYVLTLCELYRRPRHRHWGETGESLQDQVRRYGAFMDLTRKQLDVNGAGSAIEQVASLHKRLFGASK